MKTAPGIAMPATTPSAPLLKLHLDKYPTWTEADPEAWGEDSDNSSTLEFSPLPDEDLGELK